jgi:hypothetical protein
MEGGGSMDSDALLQTHAEVAIALAGFASVIAALGRPLSDFARQRFLSLLALSLIQVLGCLLPLWFLHFFESPSAGWRLVSIVILVLSVARLRWLVILPIRSLGREALGIFNPLVTKLIWGAGLVTILCLVLNAAGVPFRPGFDLYYGGLLASLLVGFGLFADVAAGRSRVTVCRGAALWVGFRREWAPTPG